jgi:DNA-directed RNA polymerase
MYAARKVLDALGNMFVNARAVMDWLNECARDIAQHGARCAAASLPSFHCLVILPTC